MIVQLISIITKTHNQIVDEKVYKYRSFNQQEESMLGDYID